MDVEDLKHRINNVINMWAGEQNTNRATGIEDPTRVDGATLTPEEFAAKEQAARGDEAAAVVMGVSSEERVLPEGKRVVRTKSSGDRVYLIDEVKKTRQWVTSPEILEGLGFESGDVTETDDTDLLGYQMGPALYRIDG